MEKANPVHGMGRTGFCIYKTLYNMDNTITIPVHAGSKCNTVVMSIDIEKFTRGIQLFFRKGQINGVYLTKTGNIVARNSVSGRVLTDILTGKKRKRTLDKIIYEIKPGAYTYTQMGRDSVGTAPTDGTRVYDSRVPLIDGCYDKGGVYWGSGHIRVKYTKDLSYIEFYRVAE
jgi:hypothetical protein